MRRTISRRLPRLSRRAKVLRNLALAAALILAFCLGTGRSAWTTQGALRRMETGLLLHPGQTLYTQRDGGQSGEQWVFVLGDTYAYTGVVRNRDLGRSLFGRNAVLYQAISLDQSPGLLSLSGWDLLGGQRENWRLFCPNPPDRAVSARLTLRAPCLWRWEDGREESQTLRFSAEGERDAYGVVSFLVQADSLEGKNGPLRSDGRRGIRGRSGQPLGQDLPRRAGRIPAGVLGRGRRAPPVRPRNASWGGTEITPRREEVP